MHYDVQELKQAPGNAGLQGAFEGLKIIDDTLQAPSTEPETFKPLRTWLGHILTDNHAEAYLIHRIALSDAVYWGDWDQIWDLLKTGHEEYQESWVNGIRMSKRVNPCHAIFVANTSVTLEPLKGSMEMSFWTPLHQAVYNRAPLEVVQDLIDHGASRESLTILKHSPISACNIYQESYDQDGPNILILI
jgi:hypothetical protein